MNSPEVAAQVAAVDAAQTKLDKVNVVKNVIDTAVTNYESLPVLTTDVISDIEANFTGTSVRWTTLSFGNGAMSVTCTARDNDEPAEVVGNFFEQDIFDNITYNGFEYKEAETEEGAAVQAGYEFTITFDMREAERPEPEEPETPAEETAETN